MTGIAQARIAQSHKGLDLGQALETARRQVEARFLEGGEVLLSVMDVLTGLLNSLERLTSSLDGDAGNDAGADLLQTARTLAGLAGLETERQKKFELIASTSRKLHTNVVDMQETMRYLRTFAVTVKITGAGIAEFAGFAQEILERIYFGTDEVNGFAGKLEALGKELEAALSLGATTSKAYESTIPKLVGALQKDIGAIADHRRNLASIAVQVQSIARGIQGKVATTLSALQIGDITRQRIEHVQSALAFLDELQKSPEGEQMDADAHSRVENVIHHLAAAQLNDITADFHRESQSVVKTIASFAQDSRAILSLRDEMSAGGQDSNFMRQLEESVSAALGVVRQVDSARMRAEDVNQSTIGTATKLLESVENIRAVKTDIHYMALNTNLRCSRMGEEGKSINVVTAELRIFAGKLDESADAIVSHLTELERVAKTSGVEDTGAAPLDTRLTSAVGAIRTAAGTVEQELAILGEQGREVATKMTLSLARLDFQNELGDVLSACADAFGHLAGMEIADIGDVTSIIQPLSARIFKTYTMVSEREIHRAIMPDLDSSPITAAAPATEEDLFAEALF